MRLETVLNRVEKNKSFVYEATRLVESGGEVRIEVEVRARQNTRPVCSGCKQRGPVYDHGKEPREFQYVPLWNIAVVLLYAMRRVNCKGCGVRVEEVPWASGKSPLSRSYAIFLARWARRLPWQEVGAIFGTSWNRVQDAVSYVVKYGLEHRKLEGIKAIGIDEWQSGRGHQYVTLVYQIEEGAKRLLYIGKDRTEEALKGFFEQLGSAGCKGLEFVCSDMWKPYMNVIKEKAGEALHILDRFHIVVNLNRAINEVRAAEAKRLKAEGYEEILKHTKYCFLKREENLTEKQQVRLKEVLQYDLKSVRAYLLKESFQQLWAYGSERWARWYLKKWCGGAMRSRLEPIKKFVKTIRAHEELMMNWFKAKKEISSGVVEGYNRKVNLVTRKSYGFRTQHVLELALYHNLGQLPEPVTTHRFC